MVLSMRMHAWLFPTIFAAALLLTANPSIAADAKCRPLCSNGGPRLAIATGSPGELGLLAELADSFCQKHSVTLCWRKAGSGGSLRLLKQGAVDAALVHAPKAEKQAVAQGWATGRTLIGGNRFYLVGPGPDPARAAQAAGIAQAYARIARIKARFITRADNSGTHKREMAIWRKAGIKPEGSWYLPSRDFMMASLRLAAREKAYFMTDSSTWVAGKARHGLEGLKVLRGNDPELFNEYHALRKTATGPKAKLAHEFIAFLASPAGQEIIANYGRKSFGLPLYENAARAARAH
jgi:tungstate transport system substrate-binding protein